MVPTDQVYLQGCAQLDQHDQLQHTTTTRVEQRALLKEGGKGYKKERNIVSS